MFPSRKKYSFHVAPSDRQLWAIGMVTVQWSQLEMWMTVFVNGLTTDDPDARAEFNQTISFKIRNRQFRALVQAKVMEPYRTQLLAIIDRVSETQQMRDRIVHGSWGDKGPPPRTPEETKASSVFGWNQPRPAFDWKLDFGQINQTALRIDEIIKNLSNVLVRASSDGGPPAHFTSSDALQRILSKPNPGP